MKARNWLFGFACIVWRAKPGVRSPACEARRANPNAGRVSFAAMPVPREKLRLAPSEIDELMRDELTVRVATVSPTGDPHVMPMWFVWDGAALWVYSLLRSRRTRDLEHGSRAAACVDTGTEYGEVRGAVLYGVFENADAHPDLPEISRTFSRRYWKGIEVPTLGSHAWLRLVPERIVSWDFRKIPSGADKRLQALEENQHL